MKLIDFVNNFTDTVFKPAKWHEDAISALESILERGDKIEISEYVQSNYKWHKQAIKDNFTCNAIGNLHVGQTFALVTVDGVRVFELTKHTPNQFFKEGKQKEDDYDT